MTLMVAPLVLCLPLLATTGLEQTRPDFSGKWTKIGSVAGEPVETLTVSQNAETLTVETQSPSGPLRFAFKLDGSESKNITVQGNPPREISQVSTATWEGSSLVVRSSHRSNREGPYLVAIVWSLDDNTLIVRTTQTSQTTGAVLRENRATYSK
jgi:hypothetical protein